MPVFKRVPWLPRVIFWLSFELLWPPLPRSILQPGHCENYLIWVDSSLMAFLEFCLVFEWLWPLLMRFRLLAWLSWKPSDLSGLDQDSPPWPSCRFPPWDSFLGQ
jgi:hypothetical protein